MIEAPKGNDNMVKNVRIFILSISSKNFDKILGY
jgi:hypothetical protein